MNPLLPLPHSFHPSSHFHIPLLPFPSPALPSPFCPVPSPTSRTTQIQLGDLWEHCELLQQGLGRSPSEKLEFASKFLGPNLQIEFALFPFRPVPSPTSRTPQIHLEDLGERWELPSRV